MATIIPCNLIEQESDRLLQIFRSCYTLTGADMDDLVNLAYSASLCGTGTGTIPTFDQNNIFTYISAISTDSTNISPVDAINARAAFTIDEKEIVIYIHRYYKESTFLSKIVNDYYFIRTGKGTYGIGGTVLDANSIFKIRGHIAAEVPSTTGTTLPPRILSLFANTVSGATISTPHTILNGQGYAVTIQDIEDTYFVIYESKVSHNAYNLYRFTGAAGSYGNGPDASVLSDFLLVDTIAETSTTPAISNGQIKVREINIPAVIGTTGITDIAKAVNLSPFKGAINVAENEILLLVVDRLEPTKRAGVNTLTTEKWLWNKGEYNDIGNASTINDYHRIETIGNTLVDGTAFANNPEIYYTTWKDLSSTTAAADAINALTGLNRVIKNDNLVLVRIADDIGGSNYKVWEFTGANGTYGVSGLTAVAGDFNSTPLVDSVDILVRAAAIPVASTVYYEDNVTTLGATDVQVAIEKLNTSVSGISTGSPFKEITTGSPNYTESTDAYRSARLGLGSTILPTEMFHLVSTQALAKGGVKIDYTYTNGGIQRSQLGGQAIYSELGAVANTVEGFNHEYFANTTDYIDNIRSYVRGGDYSGDGDAKSLTSGLGIISSTKDRYGRVHIEPHTTNNDKDWLAHLQALNEDSDFAELVARSKGTTTGFLLESQLDLYSDNLEGNSSRMLISPHIMTFDNLTQLSGYGSGIFVTGYTHTDTLVKTGVAATTLGTPAYSLNVDSNGNIVESSFVNPLEGYSETGAKTSNNVIVTLGNSSTAKTLVIDETLDRVTWGYTSANYLGINFGSSNIWMGFNAGGTFSEPSGIYSITSMEIGSGETGVNTGKFSAIIGRSIQNGTNGQYSAGFGGFHTMGQNAQESNQFTTGSANTLNAQSVSALGVGLNTQSYGEIAVGTFNTTYTRTGNSAIAWDTLDRAFIVGIGASSGAKNDGFVVYKGGLVLAPAVTTTQIKSNSTGKALVTREYLDQEQIVFRVKKSLTAAEIKTLGTTPIEIIAAPGAGKYIRVLKGIIALNWGSVAFDDNTIYISYEVDGGTTNSKTSFLNSIVNLLKDFNVSSGGSIGVNDRLMVGGTDSVATGDSTVDIYITYEIITL